MDMKTTETDRTYEYTRLTSMTVFHNLRRDHHEVTAVMINNILVLSTLTFSASQLYMVEK